MESIPCVHCCAFFIPRNRRQIYCSQPGCQKARKAAWQRNKLRTDPEYKASQKLSQQKWLRNNPDYWWKYRTENPRQAEKNRVRQIVRNRQRRSKKPLPPPLIAKMDASMVGEHGVLGPYLLVPMVAKMDVTKIYFVSI